MTADRPEVPVPEFSRATEAETVLRRLLRTAGADAVIATTGPDDLAVRFTARWPFPLRDAGLPPTVEAVRFAAGSVHTVVAHISASMVLDVAPDVLIRHLLERVEAELTASMLTALVARATELGVHRAALAPFAREVVDGALRIAYPFPAEGDRIRWAARSYTHADGKGAE